jgi:hypothetical protein
LRNYRRTGDAALAEVNKELAVGESGSAGRELGETAN